MLLIPVSMVLIEYILMRQVTMSVRILTTQYFFLADELWYVIDRPDYYLCIGGDDDCFLACGSHFLSLVNAAHGKGWSVVKKSSR